MLLTEESNLKELVMPELENITVLTILDNVPEAMRLSGSHVVVDPVNKLNMC